jgi:hypothetical protein
VISITLTFWLCRLVSQATESAPVPAATGARIRQGTGAFLLVWLGLAFALAPSSPVVDSAGRGTIPGTFLVFGGVTLTLAIGLLVFSSSWRMVVQAIPADRLISAQIYRVIGGALFLPLYAIGRFPPILPCPLAGATWRWD